MLLSCCVEGASCCSCPFHMSFYVQRSSAVQMQLVSDEHWLGMQLFWIRKLKLFRDSGQTVRAERMEELYRLIDDWRHARGWSPPSVLASNPPS